MQVVNETLIKRLWSCAEVLCKFISQGTDRSYLLADAFVALKQLEMCYYGNIRKHTSFVVYSLQTFSFFVVEGSNNTQNAPLVSVGALVYLSEYLKVVEHLRHFRLYILLYNIYNPLLTTCVSVVHRLVYL
jgi:hypothetical protein